MSTEADSARLNRLLGYLERDAANLELRKEAIGAAIAGGHWSIARRLIDAGLQASPDDAALLAHSGLVYLQALQYAEAEAALSYALARGLDAPEPRYNRAFAVCMQGRHEQALEFLTEPALSQAMPRALLLRARCLHHLGRRDEAIDECMEHLAAAPDEAETRGLLALLLYEQERLESARRHVVLALLQDSHQLEARLTLASMQSDAREYADARQSFNTLLEAHPQCGRGWLGLALIELNDQQIEAAQRAIETAAVCMPRHIGTWHVLAWIQLMRGDVAGAQVSFEKALLVDRNFAETHGGIAVVAVMQGREAEALGSIKRALRLDPEAMSPRYAEMLLLHGEGRKADAQALLDSLLARPSARGDLQYRDLVAMQRKWLRERGTGESGVVYH